MYRETITIPIPVLRIRSKVPINEIGQTTLADVLPQMEDEQSASQNLTVPAATDETDSDLINHELLYEHNELLGQIKQILQNIEQTIHNYNVEEKNALEQVFEKVPTFAFKIAEKVVHKEIKVDGAIIKATLSHALESSFEKKKLNIVLNPNDVQTIQSCAGDLGLDENEMSKKWTIEASEDILPGGCLIETQNEEIDARIESQLKALEDTILNNIGKQ